MTWILAPAGLQALTFPFDRLRVTLAYAATSRNMEMSETGRWPVSDEVLSYPACCQHLAKVYDAAHPRAKKKT